MIGSALRISARFTPNLTPIGAPKSRLVASYRGTNAGLKTPQIPLFAFKRLIRSKFCGFDGFYCESINLGSTGSQQSEWIRRS
jgi:hypothetical protein